MGWTIELAEQRLSKGQNPSGTKKYQVSGTEIATLAYALVNAAAPAVWSGLLKQNVDMEELGGGVWFGYVQYGTTEAGEPGDVTWAFQIASETLHITQALQHIEDYAKEGEPPNHKGTIGLRGEGCDVHQPSFSWEESHYVNYAAIGAGYIETLESIVAHINHAPWRIWGKGELLLLGVSGSKRGEEAVPLTYRFAVSRTRLNFSAGDITGIDKEGFHYLWLEYEPEEDPPHLTNRPKAAHVERVYDYADFTQLGLSDPWA